MSVNNSTHKKELIKEFFSAHIDQRMLEHTQSEVGNIQVQPYFGYLQVDKLNSSNYLDQMTTQDREYFSEFQEQIVQQIKNIIQNSIKKENSSGTYKKLSRSETIGVQHKNNLGKVSMQLKTKPKMKKYVYTIYIYIYIISEIW